MGRVVEEAHDHHRDVDGLVRVLHAVPCHGLGERGDHELRRVRPDPVRVGDGDVDPLEVEARGILSLAGEDGLEVPLLDLSLVEELRAHDRERLLRALGLDA